MVYFSQTFFALAKKKHLTIVHGFWPKSENFDFGKKRIPSERASLEEQNGANFSFISPSYEELGERKDTLGKGRHRYKYKCV